MAEYRLTASELKLAEIIWKNTPLSSPALVRLCEAELSWKKSTTYTMLKRLEGKKIFSNKDGVVTALLTREDFFEKQCKQFVADTFDGSLPRFLTAFARGKTLTAGEIDELQALINAHKEG